MPGTAVRSDCLRARTSTAITTAPTRPRYITISPVPNCVLASLTHTPISEKRREARTISIGAFMPGMLTARASPGAATRGGRQGPPAAISA